MLKNKNSSFIIRNFENNKTIPFPKSLFKNTFAYSAMARHNSKQLEYVFFFSV
jgi:hypothetical protein